MKAKNVYQYCLVLCGLFLALSGIACLVVATLLNHDPDLKLSRESQSRTYATQYWLGLPMIAFGGFVMLTAPSIHRKKKMAVFNLSLSIPLLTCALVAVILHGTAYTHFVSRYEERLSLEDENYLCLDITSGTQKCQCTKKQNIISATNTNEEFFMSCSQQKPLVGLHGALLAFCSVAFALLHGILVISVIFLLQFFELEVAMTTTSSGQDNEGFSHAGGRQHDSNVNVDPHLSQHPSLTSLNIPLERPPSYESLLQSFQMTPHDISHMVTYDVTNRRNREATINRNARVRHIGQMSSRFNNNTQRLSSTNEVPNSNEHENMEAQMEVNEGETTAHLSISRSLAPSHEHNQMTSQANDRQQVISGDQNTRTAERLEVVHQQTTRSEQSSEPLETRSGNTQETSDEPVFQEESNSNEILVRRNLSGLSSTTNSQEPSVEHTNEMVYTHEGRNPPTLHSNVVSNDPFIEPSEEIPSPVQRSNSNMTQHPQLESRISSESESGVYFDITENPARNASSVGATRRISVRYRGNSEGRDPSTHSLDINEQYLDSSIIDDDSPEAAEVVATENITGSEVTHNEIPPQRVNLSMSVEGSDFHPHNFDTHSINSLEIMSI